MAYLTPILLCSVLFAEHSNSYILLTANVEDVQSIAQQVFNSPVVDQLKTIWRRASKTFKKNLENPKMRADDAGDEADDRDHEVKDVRAQRREVVEQLMSIGRNASAYLGSIQKIIEKL